MTDPELAAYLDRGLGVAERERLEAHLAACAECRLHVSDTWHVLQRMRRPRRSVIAGAVAAAAAAILLVAMPAFRADEQGGRAPVVRGSDLTSRLTAYGPVGETAVDSPRFVWSAGADAVTYRLTVTRGDGAVVWSFSGVDTVAALPDSIVLSPGQRYLWVVDALLSDGTTRSTGLREFGRVP